MKERKNKRLPVGIGCWMLEVDGASCFHTFDISESGVSMITTELLPVGKRVELQFFTPHSAEGVTVRAEVVWSQFEPESAMGLRFMETNAATRTKLNEFIRLVQLRGINRKDRSI